MVGSASFILKKNLKLLKKNIKVWRDSHGVAGGKEMKEAREVMIQWDMLQSKNSF